MGKPKIFNIVASGQFPQSLDIEKLYHSLDVEGKVYEPEVYPALLIKMRENRYHVTLYQNGKYIITGVQSKMRWKNWKKLKTRKKSTSQ